MNPSDNFAARVSHIGKLPNRLSGEKSPYLLQHAHNPVDWYPWGDEAFHQAKLRDKPIFLSVGYSTCYWCHVMEREVFENPALAALMNESFVNVKVDREERPDVDRVYMTALQTMTGSGGWPMSMFLTPDLKPFFGATYIPPVSRHGRLGFADLAGRIDELWRMERATLIDSSDQLYQILRSETQHTVSQEIRPGVLVSGFAQFEREYDPIYGGFGSAPKFPRPAVLNFLLQFHQQSGEARAKEMALATLRKMANGGVRDHLGGGFHRYSVDQMWRVPHFEKMLYDQALLSSAYIDAFRLSGDGMFASVARETLDYVLNQLTSQQGGFYSAEDAESVIDPAYPEEKAEGHFYLWTKSKILHEFEDRIAEFVCAYFGIEESGNTISDPHGVFGNKNVLHVARSIFEVSKSLHIGIADAESILRGSVEKLRVIRSGRPRPQLDDKVLTSWNGLMIAAMARGYQVFEDTRYLVAAQQAAGFILDKMYDRPRGCLLHRWRDGEARFDASLDDYAFFVHGLLDLYEASFDASWIDHGIQLTEEMICRFFDNEQGGFWTTSGDDPSIILRMKENYDGAEPTGNAIALMNLIRLARLTGNPRWSEIAGRTLLYFGDKIAQIPQALPQLLAAACSHLNNPIQIVIVGERESEEVQAMLREIYRRYIPSLVLLFADGEDGQARISRHSPFIASLKLESGQTMAHVCENFVCHTPVRTVAALADQLDKLEQHQ